MIREIDETILTEEEIKEFQKDKDSFIKKREKELKNFIGEEWKPIDGYGGLYWLSNYGRVKSSEKVVRNRVYPEKIMSYTQHKKYKQTLVKISKNGKQKTFIIENLLEKSNGILAYPEMVNDNEDFSCCRKKFRMKQISVGDDAYGEV